MLAIYYFNSVLVQRIVQFSKQFFNARKYMILNAERYENEETLLLLAIDIEPSTFYLIVFFLVLLVADQVCSGFFFQ